MKVIEEDSGYGEICEHDGIKFHVSHASLITESDKETARIYAFLRKKRQMEREAA